VFVLAITAPDGTTRRQIFTASEIHIGSRDDSDLCVPTADVRHARIVIHHSRYILVDLKSNTGTYCNERRLTAPLIVTPSDAIRVVEHRVQIVDVAPARLDGGYVARDPFEQALLDAIVDGDEASRLVYADWLESVGEGVHAEIVRRVGNGGRPTVPFLQLLLETTVAWRVRVVRPPIEGCARETGCPGDWGALVRTDREDLRTCRTCTRAVRYCSHVDDAREHLDAGGCAVLDPLSLRWSNDLPSRLKPG